MQFREAVALNPVSNAAQSTTSSTRSSRFDADAFLARNDADGFFETCMTRLHAQAQAQAQGMLALRAHRLPSPRPLVPSTPTIDSALWSGDDSTPGAGNAVADELPLSSPPRSIVTAAAAVAADSSGEASPSGSPHAAASSAAAEGAAVDNTTAPLADDAAVNGAADAHARPAAGGGAAAPPESAPAASHASDTAEAGAAAPAAPVRAASLSSSTLTQLAGPHLVLSGPRVTRTPDIPPVSVVFTYSFRMQLLLGVSYSCCVRG